MSTLFLYTIKAAFVLTLLYVPYTLMLRREKFHRFNRLTLLLILALSLVLPLCNISSLSMDNNPIVHVAQQQMISVGIPIRQIVVTASAVPQASSSSLSWFDIASIIYLIGMATVLLVRLVQFARMGLVIRGGSLWKHHEDGITIYCHANDVAPFSWLRNIVISEQDYNDNGREIILHEKGHILARHSLDIILLTLVEMLQWWNPISYMLGISLRDIHEFEADHYVLSQGVSAHQYQTLLIKKAVGSSSYTFANNFNHSLIIKRITMMQKSKSNPWMRSKVLYIIPLAVLSLSAFATPQLMTPVEKAVQQLDGKGKEKNADVQVKIEETTLQPSEIGLGASETQSAEQVAQSQSEALPSASEEPQTVGDTIKDDRVFDVAEVVPQFKGGNDEMYKFLAENIRYPKIAQECGVIGRVYLQFIVEKDGTIDEKNLKFIKTISKGDNVSKVEGEGPDVVVTSYKKKEGDVQYLSEAEFETSRKALEEEAKRVILKSSGNWEPGLQKGKKVRVRFTLPIAFRLQ